MRQQDDQGRFVSLYDQPLKVVGVKMTVEDIKALDAIAKKKGITRSDLIRQGIELILQQA